ncbi:MAG: YeeE/YedE family protein [Leptospiraceae bacterium]|nr:YeeE/YedE family protein [Leptospiraceae bacterium]
MNELENKKLEPKEFWSPYVAGTGLGIVLLLSFVFMGRGLGASGALTRLSAYFMNLFVTSHTSKLSYLQEYLSDDYHVLNEFLVFMLAGVFVGGFISAAFAGRVKYGIEKGPTFPAWARLVLAFGGGIVSAYGARLARGCTSGQALTGGASLALGSWIFMICAFAGGYALAYFVRRQWK